MIEPRPSVTRFVQAVVRAELASRGGTQDSAVTMRIMMRLHQDLGKLVGPAGFDVLLARSLVLARRAHPILAGITSGSGGTLAGFEGAGEGAALEDAATAVVSHFIELLVTLIGEDLAMRLVRDIWPTVDEKEKK